MPNTPSVLFDTALARELTTFENQVGLKQALKWRLNEACDEIDRLRREVRVVRSLLEAHRDPRPIRDRK